MIMTFSMEHNRFSNIEHLEKELSILAENLLMIINTVHGFYIYGQSMKLIDP